MIAPDMQLVVISQPPITKQEAEELLAGEVRPPKVDVELEQ